ncbi:uncharacterized protein LOC142578242 [Dermacentor variabilis]|uniref:uncharacterized protein LOC142578242 n=1 Tax=Dermacentor variabilis TaxID=34621 RepID=UPI003F5C6630
MKCARGPTSKDVVAQRKAAVSVDLPLGLGSLLEAAVGSNASSASTSSESQQPGAASFCATNVSSAQSQLVLSGAPSSAGTSPPAGTPLAAGTASSGSSTSTAEKLLTTTTETSSVAPENSEITLADFYNVGYIPFITIYRSMAISRGMLFYLYSLALASTLAGATATNRRANQRVFESSEQGPLERG